MSTGGRKRLRGQPALVAALGATVAAAAAAPLVAALAVAARHAHEIYHPPRQPPGRTPSHHGLPWRETTLVTRRDGLRLRLWILPGSGPHTVVVCHGMGRTRSSVLQHARMLHDAGYNVVAFDLRNHGESEGDRAVGDMAERFSSDLVDVVEHARRDVTLGGGRIAVLAFSFSAWTAIYSLRSCPHVSAVVCDSGPALDIRGLLAHLFDLRRRTLPPRYAKDPLYRLCRWAYARIGWSLLGLQHWPTDVPAPGVPLLFVTNANDRLMAAEQVLGVVGHYPWAESWVSPNGIHMNALRLDREEYVARVTGFLDSVLEPAAGPDRQRAAVNGRG